MTDRVTLFEVGPRDGLQNEARQIPTPEKIALVDALSAAGLPRIEVTSFVSPRWVPQMADAAEVLAGIARAPGVAYTALTPNLRGLQGAMAAGVDAVAVFASASEGFSQANINCSVAESLERFAPVLEVATRQGLPVRGYISCVVECPFDGPVAPRAVAALARDLRAMGCHEISLGDTLGRAAPDDIAAMLDAVLAEVLAGQLAGHYHDTSGLACANVEVSLERGLRVFDAAVGGLGGCPYAPGAAGNVATEAVLDLVTALGFETGVDAEGLARAGALARKMKETGS